MIRTLFALLFGLISLSASSQAVISFDKTNLSFGNFKEEQIQKAVFVITNTGDKPLVIQQAFSSCGCTVASFTKTPIEPGKKGELIVSYDGKGKFPGHFKKTITIRSNASNSLARVYIEGTMEKK